MGIFLKSSGKRQCSHKSEGSNYYKREGFLSRILKMFGSFSNSVRGHNNNHSQDSHQSHHSDQRHYSDQNHHRRRDKGSWS